ncbi:MAG: MlaD family protein [Desulfocapsaceae bacterium]|nr:MlaD family protein [Desulfocapsaceae bacterium]
MDTRPVVRKKRGISPVWTLPLIALLICGWILFRAYQNAGIEITIYFEDASGITAGKTQIVSRGIPVGLVKEVKPDLDKHRICTTVKMDKEMGKYLMKDTTFWIVRPELSAARVYGLETILSGSYIGVQTGISTEPEREFTGLSTPPPVSANAPGLHLFLKADALRSIQVGSGIYYRNIRIGTVQTYSLENDDNVIINTYIEPAYSHLVREGSRFRNASGFGISGKLTDLKFHVESIASLIMGGIVLDTPEPLESSPPSRNGQTFTLYKDIDASRYVVPMSLRLSSSNGITEGVTKVIYHGMNAGIVDNIEFNNDAQHMVTAHILLDPRAKGILKQGTTFWINQPEIGISGIKNLDTALDGPYITFEPGEGQFQDHFEILATPPAQTPLRPGTEYFLTTDNTSPLSVGAPVIYKNVQVGEIVSVDLTQDRIRIKIFIYQPHEQLLQQNSVFWNSSGIKVDAGLFSGLKVDVGSLSSLLQGGITLFNPDPGKKKTLPAKAGQTFTLYNSFNEAVAKIPSLQPMGYSFQLKADDLGPYKVGSPILFKKVTVGEVVGFHFSGRDKDVLIDCFIKQPYQDMVSSTSRFFDLSGIHVEGGLSGLTVQTGSLESIVSAGIGFISPPGGKRPEVNAVYTLFKTEDAARIADDLKMTIRFAEASDLKAGTLVKYKGIPIGKVTETRFAGDLKTIIAEIAVKKEFLSLFRTATQLWLASPSVSLSGIKNLDTVTSGPYIAVAPGEGQLSREFVALDEEPQVTIPQQGLNLVLTSKRLGSLKIHSPVYYRQVKVGEITGFALSKSFQNVQINVNIAHAYARIIRENTRFWNVSGAKFDAGLFSGVTVSAESVEAIVAGGIALATPDGGEMGGKVDQGHRFDLYDEAESCWLTWAPYMNPADNGQAATP